MWEILSVWDTEAFRLINGIPRHDGADAFGRLLSSAYLWWAVAGVLMVVGLWRRRATALRGFALCLLSVGITDVFCAQVLKPYFDRERPCWQVPDRQLRVVSCGGKYSLPSNHAANGMAVVTSTAGLVSAGATAGLAVLVVVVGLSRVFLGVHYPGDVLLGFVVGGLIGWAVRRSLGSASRFVKKRQESVPVAS